MKKITREKVGRVKHKNKYHTIWLELDKGEPQAWLIELEGTPKRARRFADIMHWAQKHSARIEYLSLRKDLGEIDKKMNGKETRK